MQVYTATAAGQEGPFTVDQINQSLRTGQLPAQGSLAWYEGCADWIPLHQLPGVSIPNAVASGTPPPPPLPAFMQQPQVEGSSIIPTKNPPALTSYYLGIFALIPVLGILLAIPAVFLGISGYKRYRRNPLIKGAAHAWIGIILGGASLLGHVLVTAAIFAASRR